jgi:hypothetical protein
MLTGTGAGAVLSSVDIHAPPTVVSPMPRDPADALDWWRDAVVYQIFPDRFAPDPAGPPPGVSLDAWVG